MEGGVKEYLLLVDPLPRVVRSKARRAELPPVAAYLYDPGADAGVGILSPLCAWQFGIHNALWDCSEGLYTTESVGGKLAFVRGMTAKERRRATRACRRDCCVFHPVNSEGK